MSGKLRVHELAKQLGVTSKELLATLKEQGEFVKTASSTIEPPVVKKMKAHYAKQNGGGDAADQNKEEAAPKKPPPTPSTSLSPTPASLATSCWQTWTNPAGTPSSR